jgi:peptidoglycan-associated lipoprotein
MKQLHAGLILGAAMLVLLQGCTGSATTRGDDISGTEQGVGVGDGTGGAMTEVGPQTGTAEMGGGTFAGRPIQEVLSDPDTPLSKRVFYFDFNSSELSAEDREALSYHARFLSEFPNVSLVLEGHADERGSREYNLALGERRAKAIERILHLEGVVPEQVQVISFGEERPVALGHDDESWRLNRRVELLYSGY